jgi:hypothetical protein
MARDTGGGAPGMGGSGPEGNLLTSAASAAVNPQIAQAQAAQIIQALIQSRLGGGSRITMGPQMPSKPRLPQPSQQVGGPGIPQGSFQSTGERQRADKQALFGTIANIVQGAEKKHYDMKVDKIKADFETLSNAIQGYQEAQASGNKDAAEHNAKIINSIVMDPKKSKEMAKAFEVDLNPIAEKKKQEKPNPAQDALKAAFAKDAQAYANKQTPLTPQAQAFMNKMPQRAGIDPRVALMEQLTKSGVLPKTSEELTFTKDLMEVQQRIKNNELTNDTKTKIATMFAETRDRNTQAGLLRTAMTIKGANDRMDTLMKMWQYRADKGLEGVKTRVDELKNRFNAKSATTANDKKFAEFITSLDKQEKGLKDQLSAATKLHNTDQIMQINKQIDNLRMMQELATAEAAKRVGMNPEDFSHDPMQLKDDEMQQFIELFKGNDDATDQ